MYAGPRGPPKAIRGRGGRLGRRLLEGVAVNQSLSAGDGGVNSSRLRALSGTRSRGTREKEVPPDVQLKEDPEYKGGTRRQASGQLGGGCHGSSYKAAVIYVRAAAWIPSAP